MKKRITILVASMFLLSAAAAVLPAFGADGKALFESHCAVCHPNGGNIINPKKTLKKDDLTANGITGPADIVKTMRNPGPGMRVFTEKDLPAADANAIAGYVWDTVSR